MSILTLYRALIQPNSLILFCPINQLLYKISKEQKQIFLLSDFNINLLNYNKHQLTNDFRDILASDSIIPYLLQPTSLISHSNNVIDNIFLICFLEILLIIYPSFFLLPTYFQILYAINQISQKENRQNSTKKDLFLITLMKIGLAFSN